jgi:hypothetical protein
MWWFTFWFIQSCKRGTNGKPLVDWDNERGIEQQMSTIKLIGLIFLSVLCLSACVYLLSGCAEVIVPVITAPILILDELPHSLACNP